MARINQKDILEKDTLQVSTFLEYNPKYSKLSGNARRLYAILLKRFEMTRWRYEAHLEDAGGTDAGYTYIDEFGDLFAICSNYELKFWFRTEDNYSITFPTDKTIIKLKKELRDVGLIEEVKQSAWRPNRIYAHQPESSIEIRQKFKDDLKKYKELQEVQKKVSNMNWREQSMKKTEREKNRGHQQTLYESHQQKRHPVENYSDLVDKEVFHNPKTTETPVENRVSADNTNEVTKITPHRGYQNYTSVRCTNGKTSTKEYTSINMDDSSNLLNNTVNNLFVNKNEFDIKKNIKDICNDFYDVEAQVRWNVFEWDVLIDSFILTSLEKIIVADNPRGYIRGAITNMCNKNAVKYLEIKLFKYRGAALIYENMNPESFLEELLVENGGDGVIQEIPNTWSLLVQDLQRKMSNGVINVLFEFVLRYTNGRMPQSFIPHVISTWTKEDIKTADQAINFVERTFEEENTERGYAIKLGRYEYTSEELWQKNHDRVSNKHGTAKADELYGVDYVEYQAKMNVDGINGYYDWIGKIKGDLE